MERECQAKLVEWKDSRNRKPLVMRGARQTGKTWLLKQFGIAEFENTVYIDLLENTRARSFFDADLDPKRIVSLLSVETDEDIVPGKTLVILDEIQEAPRALTALKYFQQDMPELHIAAAGSYLGIASHVGESFPVGKVDTVDLQPLSFFEFLSACGQARIAKILKSSGAPGIDDAFSGKLETLLKEYLYVGGMPEVVADFALHHDFIEARRLQSNILADYDNDFSKHAPARILERMRLVWASVPAQLARENRKFVYGALRPSARAREFEESIQWLIDYGVVIKVPRVSALRSPLAGYEDGAAFKLFCVDTGLLGALAGLDAKVLLDGPSVFVEFKGALTEQYVCQQMIVQGLKPFYWSSDTGDAEVDFAFDSYPAPVPVEVKAAENLKAKSLKVAQGKFGLPRTVRTSLAGFRDEGTLVNVPLWAAGNLRSVL